MNDTFEEQECNEFLDYTDDPKKAIDQEMV